MQCTSKEPTSRRACITPVPWLSTLEAVSTSDCLPCWAYNITTSKIRLSSPARTIWPWATWTRTASSPTCPSSTSPWCPPPPSGSSVPSLASLYRSWIWWQWHIRACHYFPPAAKCFHQQGSKSIIHWFSVYNFQHSDGDAWHWRTFKDRAIAKFSASQKQQLFYTSGNWISSACTIHHTFAFNPQRR